MSTANAKEETRRRTALLKKMREERKESVARVQVLLKEQKKIQQQISQVLRSDTRTVPEVAQATGLPAQEILWYMTAMKQYGLILETGKSGDYYLYRAADAAAEPQGQEAAE